MDTIIKLTYTGEGRYLMCVPARDLSDYDLEELSVLFDNNLEGITNYLVESGIYQLDNRFICSTCGRVFKSWDKLNTHELKHIEDVMSVVEEMNNEEEANNG